jgi:hypothetical protein
MGSGDPLAQADRITNGTYRLADAQEEAEVLPEALVRDPDVVSEGCSGAVEKESKGVPSGVIPAKDLLKTLRELRRWSWCLP